MSGFKYKGKKKANKSMGKKKGGGKSKTQTVKSIAKQAVQQYMKKNVETKKGYLEPTNAGFNTQASNNFSVLPNIRQTNCYQLLPEISIGTTVNNRIGNKIKPKGLYVSGHIAGDWLNIVANNASFQNMYVRLLCVADKQNNVDSLAYNAFASSYVNLLNKGGTSTDFLFSDQTSLYRPVNKERFTVYFDKVIKIGLYSANVGTANVDQTHGIRTFKFKVPIKEEFVYDDTNTRPTNASMPLLLCGYCPADNRNITAGATTSFIKLTYYTDFYYTDE